MSAGEESGPFTRESVYYDADEVQAKQPASTAVFKSVANAGRLLASHLSAQYLNTNTNPVSVIALSKNAMPMAKEIAQHLDAPLDFIGIQVISVEYTGALMWVALCGPGTQQSMKTRTGSSHDFRLKAERLYMMTHF